MFNCVEFGWLCVILIDCRNTL